MALLLVLALVSAGCSGDSSLGAGDAATVGEGSTVEFSVDGGEWVERVAGEVIPSGAQVRAVDDEARLEFRAGTARLSELSSATVTADRITVQRGHVLVDSRGSFGGAFEDTTVSGKALYRLVGGLAPRVGVYRGAVTVQRPAQKRAVAALRQVDLAAVRLDTPDPLRYRPTDAWDAELLGAAIAFDGEAARLSNGMDRQLGDDPRPARFYRRFVTQNNVVSLLTDAAPASPPADVLLPLFVAQAAPGALRTALQDVTSLRASGARWGLIALELDVASRQVVAAIDALGDDQLVATARDTERQARGAERGNEVRTASADTSGAGTEVAAGDDTTSTGSSDPGDTDPGDDPVDPTDPTLPGGGGGKDPEPPGPTDPPEPPNPVEEVVNEVVKTVETGGEGGSTTDVQLPDLPLPLGGDDDQDD